MALSNKKPTITITQEQVEFFRREGYLSIPEITTQEEVARLRVIYDRLFESRVGREEGNQFDLAGADEEDKQASLPQILNPVKYEPELEHTLFRANAFAISKQLLGPETRPGGEHAIFKPARHGAATPWHQDEAYWNPQKEYFSLSVWMPLQEATVENGCLWFVPGSHQSEVLPHHSINNDPRVHGLEVDEPEKHTQHAVACPLPAGGATFHRNATLHYASANTTDIPRRAYIHGFGRPAKERSQPRRFIWNEKKQTARELRRQKSMVKELQPLTKD